MKKVFILALFVVLLTACNKGYKIVGTVDNAALNGKYVYLYEYASDVEIPADSALVENGAFLMTGSINTPKLFMLAFDKSDVPPQRPVAGLNSPYTAIFPLENMKLKANLTETPSVTGTPENDALTALQDKIRSYTINEQLVEDVKGYIIQNPTWLSSANLLFDFRYELDENFRREAISKGGEVFLSSPNIDKMIEHLAVLEKTGAGTKFTDFTLNDPEGKPVKLSDYAGKGKTVLVDFWASWCPPCRADMPHLVDVYALYKDKGFEIVGVSLDRNNADWVKGIQDLNITWPQMSDLKYWASHAAALYGVNSIPHTVLIDANGTIIAKNLRGQALDEMLTTIFN